MKTQPDGGFLSLVGLPFTHPSLPSPSSHLPSLVGRCRVAGKDTLHHQVAAFCSKQYFQYRLLSNKLKSQISFQYLSMLFQYLPSFRLARSCVRQRPLHCSSNHSPTAISVSLPAPCIPQPYYIQAALLLQLCGFPCSCVASPAAVWLSSINGSMYTHVCNNIGIGQLVQSSDVIHSSGHQERCFRQ